jgi:hypothetical protein
MKILNKHGYWWKNEEKQWVAQDKSGNWWLYNREETPAMETKSKRKGERSNKLTTERYIILVLASALGVSLALNIVTILS